MEVNWNKFAERVPAGSLIRWQPEKGFSVWEGVLLENIPCPEEAIEDWWESSKELQDAYEHFYSSPTLRVQDFNQIDVDEVYFTDGVEFLIDGQWMTFEAVMDHDQ